MLVTLVASHDPSRAQREADRYAGWSAAIQRLRDDGKEGKPCEIREIRGYLTGVPEDQLSEALQDLVAEHLRLTWQAGEGARLEAYLAELGPEIAQLSSPAVVPADLVEDEVLARYRPPHGDTPGPEEYERRFPRRPDVLDLIKERFLDAGRFVRLYRRGQGAMGEVWEAYDRHLRCPVAIKEPRRGEEENAALRGQFAEEARATAELEHPGIACLREHRPADGAAPPLYVMRLVDGQTLGERVQDYHTRRAARNREEQRLLWRQLLESLASACEAIAYAHARGVLHRDLKPGNVAVGKLGETVILDWGACRRTPPAPSSGAVVGTPDYMPPEQADGVADERSDVFGLGAILYEVLTGRPPHSWPGGIRPARWTEIVRQARFPPPRRTHPRTPRALEAVCLKALARSPGDRYPSAAALTQDVRRYLAGEPVSAWIEPAPVKVWRWLRGRL